MSASLQASTSNHEVATSTEHRPTAYRRMTAALPRFGVLGVVLAIFIWLSAASPAFLTSQNLLNIVDQWTPTAMVACAVTFVMIAGALDLSVAANLALCCIVAAKLAPHLGVALAMAIAVAVGAVVGVFNGLAWTRLKISPIIVTFTSAIILAGLGQAMTNSQLILVSTPSFGWLGNTRYFDVTVRSYILFGLVVVLSILLHATSYGRYVFAVGGNSAAARLSGVRVDAIKMSVYIMAGFATGIAGIVTASRLQSAQTNVVPGMEINVIAAVVVGGTSIMGGSGAMWRTLTGVALLALIGNGSDLLGINSNYQQMIYGGIIFVAAATDALTRRRK